MTSCLEQGYLDPEDPFTIINPDFYILFLGDYVDRGWYGCEVLYTIARLKCANPNRVFMIRGNHEDPSLNRKYGFTQELRNKFQSPEHIESLCGRFYRLLPIVLYLGTKHDFVQCCHGGIEPGFDPKPLLATVHKRYGQKIATLSPEHFVMSDRITSFATLKHYFTNPRVTDAHNGFMWNDFIVDQNDMLQIQLSSRDGYSGTMFRFGKVPTHEFLNVCSTEQKRLRCIFRAHQHSDSLIRERMLNLDQIGHEDDVGVAKLWIDSPVHSQTPHLLEAIDVVTFWVAPRTGYKTSIHAFGLLTLARDYNDWRLKTVRIVDDSI
ncbi:MAG: metallophosphoesterase [Epsilonproteobacteria bacterium]|nr:metallophosphoesterase [Campylobacterota bacterium]